MDLKFDYKTETKTCYRFETGERPDLMSLYLKKNIVDKAGIDPKAGIIVSVRQAVDNK